MELIIKSAATALIAAVVGLLIKRSNPEISILLSSCTVAVIITSAIGFANGIKELAETVRIIGGGSETFALPVLKCVAIATITKLSTELCRDNSQVALASAVEFAGTLCAVSVTMPFVMSMLKMIGAMV